MAAMAARLVGAQSGFNAQGAQIGDIEAFEESARQRAEDGIGEADAAAGQPGAGEVVNDECEDPADGEAHAAAPKAPLGARNPSGANVLAHVSCNFPRAR